MDIDGELSPPSKEMIMQLPIFAEISNFEGQLFGRKSDDEYEEVDGIRRRAPSTGWDFPSSNSLLLATIRQ